MKNYLNKCKFEFLNIAGSDIPDSEYFKLPGTSISKLKNLDEEIGGSPDKYLNGTNFGYNESTLLGTCVHTYFLQPDEFEVSEYEKPSGKLGYFIEKLAVNRQEGYSIYDSIIKSSKETDYYQNVLINGSKDAFKKRFTIIFKEGYDYYNKLMTGYFKSDKEIFVLSKNLLKRYKECISSIKRNNIIKKFLTQNIFEEKQFLNEIALFSDIKVTLPDNSEKIIHFKGKLDSVIIDPEKKKVYLNDIKTTSKGIDYFMDKIYESDNVKKVWLGTFTLSDYHVQMAAYMYLLQKYCTEVLNLKDYKYECNMWVVETTNQYKCENFRIAQRYIIDAGYTKFKELLARLAFHELNGFDKEFEYGNV